MIVFLTLAYVAVLFVLIKIKILPNTKANWLSTIVWMVVLFIFLFIPMQWGAPSGPVRIVTRAVQIIPNVNGRVIEIPVRANTPLKQGDIPFQLDPEPFELAVRLAEATKARVEAQVEQDQDALASALAQQKQAEARLRLAQKQYEDDKQLADRCTIPQNRLGERQSNLDAALATMDQMRAPVSRAEAEIGAVTKAGVIAKLAEANTRLEQAKWNLDQATVRAPSDGFATNLALSVGQRATNLPFSPAMVFIDTPEKIVVKEIHQIYLRHLEPGQPVELAFKSRPGVIVPGSLDQILEVSSGGQAMVTGGVARAGQIRGEPDLVRIKPDNPENIEAPFPGTVGTSAIYTQNVTATHVIRKVILRMEAIMNYVKPGL